MLLWTWKTFLNFYPATKKKEIWLSPGAKKEATKYTNNFISKILKKFLFINFKVFKKIYLSIRI